MASLSEMQQAWNLIREAADEAAARARAYEAAGARDNAQFETGRQAGLVAALETLRGVDPDADGGWFSVPGRVYGPEIAYEVRDPETGEIREVATKDGMRHYFNNPEENS